MILPPYPFSAIVGDADAKKALEKGSAPQDYAFALKVKAARPAAGLRKSRFQDLLFLSLR